MKNMIGIRKEDFMKKILLFVICGILLVGIAGCAQDNKEQTTNNTENQNVSEDNQDSNIKSLVLYFSATGTTENVAEKIAEISNSDIIEIIPKEEYTSADLDYNNDDCRANKEQNNPNARPEIKNNIDIDGYDRIYLGYPIWWGTYPKIIFALLDTINFDNKNVVLFATSGGSDISQSEKDLKAYNKNMNILGSKLLNGSVSESDIDLWIKSLNK